MSDMRATERLLEVIAEQSDDHEVQQAVVELQRRGDTLVRGGDLRLVAAAANHGRKFGPSGDTDYTGFNAALERIESALGGSLYVRAGVEPGALRCKAASSHRLRSDPSSLPRPLAETGRASPPSSHLGRPTATRRRLIIRLRVRRCNGRLDAVTASLRKADRLGGLNPRGVLAGVSREPGKTRPTSEGNRPRWADSTAPTRRALARATATR